MMRIGVQARELLNRLVFGPVDFPQQCPVGLRDPQADVAVWLHGMGTACNVTRNHLMACGAPFTIGIGLDDGWKQFNNRNAPLTLKFCERHPNQRLLGEIALQWASVLPVGNQQLALFHVKDYRNYCLPKARLWAHYLRYARQRSRLPKPDVAIAAREIHAMIVFYICPRPVALVSVVHGTIGNIFPMNLMGSIGNEHFCFALNSATPVTDLVERVGGIAVTSIPMEQRSLAIQFGKHHREKSIDLGQLPFATKRSTALGLPVPEFALRVREMKIESARMLGSHTMFVARVVQDERRENGLEFFVEHGIYRVWRERHGQSRSQPLQYSSMSSTG
jgi:flavin reductase (DIM6/NTAB) family NADH-FMN oxidoreductase RutF